MYKKGHIFFNKVMILCMFLLCLVEIGCSGTVPLSVEEASVISTSVVGSIDCVKPIREICLDMLMYDYPKARNMNKHFHTTPAGDIECSDGGQIECFIENNTTPTGRLRGEFAYTSIRNHRSCKRGNITTNGTAKARYEGPDVISRLISGPTFDISFSNFTTFDATNGQNIQLNGDCHVKKIAEEFRSAVFVLNMSFSATFDKKGTQTTIGAKYKNLRIESESHSIGEIYKIFGNIESMSFSRKMNVSTEEPLFIPKNQCKPERGVVVIKAGGDKIKVVFAKQEQNIYLNGSAIQ